MILKYNKIVIFMFGVFYFSDLLANPSEDSDSKFKTSIENAKAKKASQFIGSSAKSEKIDQVQESNKNLSKEDMMKIFEFAKLAIMEAIKIPLEVSTALVKETQNVLTQLQKAGIAVVIFGDKSVLPTTNQKLIEFKPKIDFDEMCLSPINV